jgi:hypothetical protein
MEALKRNTYNFEAAVYLGVVGFALALAEGDEREMQLSLQNLKTTEERFPQSRLLSCLVEQHEARFTEFLGRARETNP